MEFDGHIVHFSIDGSKKKPFIEQPVYLLDMVDPVAQYVYDMSAKAKEKAVVNKHCDVEKNVKT